MRLIDANALKDYFQIGGDETSCEGCEHLKARGCYEERLLSDFCSAIDEQPTIDAEPQWIPCSERLPENMEPVNITWVNRDPVPYYMHIKDKPFTATGIYYKGKWFWWSSTCDDILCEYGENEIDEVDGGIEIVAWMPLPKPYEVEE